MGAWGSQPKDNDTSGDQFDDVASAAAKAVNKLFRSDRAGTYARWERLGTLQLVTEQMPAVVPYLQDAFKVAALDVVAILSDEDWFASWKQPSETKSALRAFGKAIGRVLAKM
jgi:hypothetical protein